MRTKNTTYFGVFIVWSYELNCPTITDFKLIGDKEEEHFINLEQLAILREEMLKRFDVLVEDARKSPTQQVRLGLAEALNSVR
jgi:hypothetical protein